jgi:ribose transport system substrate-binding protein
METAVRKITRKLPSGRVSRWLLLLLAASVLVMSGCRNETADTPPAPAQGAEKSEQGASLTFGIIYPFAHPFYEMITEAAMKAAEPRRVRLIVQAPDEANLEQQIRMMETMIKQRVDGIAVDPVDATAMKPVIDKAVSSGIPVICFESDSPDSRRLSFIGSDNRKAGLRMGEVLNKLLHGTGMVLVETGMNGMSSHRERLGGMLDYLKAETHIQVLEVRDNEGSEAAALADLEAMIEDHPHFDAFIALDLISGSTSVLVWKAMGLKRHALTFGMIPEFEDAIRNGQITAAVSSNERTWGQRIVERLLQASKGEAIPPFDDTGIREITLDRLVLQGVR